jgi:DHA2 family multidrug resistance protein
VAATLLTRFQGQARAALVAHVTGADPPAVERLRQIAGAFVGRGRDALAAHDLALRALDGVVERQAMLLSFDRVFLMAGVAFLAVLPLLAFLKTPEVKSPKVDLHLE